MRFNRSLFVIPFITICIVSGVCALTKEINSREASGTCGDKLKWTLNDEGTLTITGEGKMKDFPEFYTPWHNDYRLIIKTIVISNGVTTIGNSAFEGFEFLTDVFIPDTVTSIGFASFSGCYLLAGVSLPDSLLSIGKQAFDNCWSIKNVTIPASVTSIGERAFDRCYRLESIYVASGNKNFASVAGVLFDDLYTTLIKYPQGSPNSVFTIPATVTSIDSNAFRQCKNLASFSVAEGNTRYCSIDGVLLNASGTSIILYPPGNTSTKYSTPTGVILIESKAFQYNPFLESVNISEGVISFGDSVFEGCSSLRTMMIPSSLTSIGEDSFAYCASLTSFTVDENNKHFSTIDGVLFSRNQSVIVQYPLGKGTSYVIPDRVRTIGRHAFETSNLTTVVIPESVTRIGDAAFWRSNNLTNVIIPDSVVDIEGAAFGDTGITEVTIPESVKSIGIYAFGYCYKLTSVFYQGYIAFSNPKVLFASQLLDTLCVSPAYNSTSFCGVNVTSESPVCQTYKRLFNHCYKGAFINGCFVQQKWMNATQKENEKTHGCARYQCQNETGEVELYFFCEQRDCCHSVCDMISGECKYSRVAGWEELHEQENACFEVVCDSNEWIVEKRKNATEWEHLTNECAEFMCHNESGLTGWSLCNSTAEVTRACVNNKCIVDDSLPNTGVIVEIELNEGIRVVEMNTTEILEYINVNLDIDTKNMIISWQCDEKGDVIFIFVHANDEQTADILAEMIKGLNKGKECNGGVLCKTKRIQVKRGIEISSCPKAFLMNMALGLLVLFFLLFI